MRTIWKTPITEPVQTVKVKTGAVPLTAQMQNGDPTIWWLLDDSKPDAERTVYVIGTGHEVPVETSHHRYVGTVQMDALVWHVFLGDDAEPF